MEVIYEFERWRLHLNARQLEVNGRVSPLGARALGVLRVLVENADQPVAKERLLQEVWSGCVVEEGNLPVQVSALRKLLGVDSIMMVPGRGYQLVTSAPNTARSRTAVPATFPARSPAVHRASGIAPCFTPLIGRDHDLGELLTLLRGARLVSLVGAGGVGKTRLATAAVEAISSEFPEGVWWVDLAGAQRPAEVSERIAIVMGVTLSGAGDRTQLVARAMRGERRLLVLDNCEHLVAAVASVVHALLAHQQPTTIMVTTQVPLRLPDEEQYRLAPLCLPDPGMALTQAMQTGALELLVKRAHAADSQFQLDASALPAAVEICRALDGNALALEMAASRLPWMGVHGVATRLAERFRMLSVDSRIGMARHRSLQMMLEWSYGLLTPIEKMVFWRLGVFNGTFALDVVPAVVCAGTFDEWEAIDALGVLVERSFVQLTDDAAKPGRLRYRLLDTPRLFAREQLEVAGELQSTLLRHASALSARCAVLNDWFWSDDEDIWLAEVRPDLANLNLALDTALGCGAWEEAVELFEALTNAERIAPGGRQTWSWNERLQPLVPQAPTPLRARLLLAMGTALRNVQPDESGAMFARGLRELGTGGDHRIKYMLLSGMATNVARAGDTPQAVAVCAQAVELADPHWPPKLRALVVLAAAFIAVMRDEPAQAEREFRRVQELAHAARSSSLLTIASLNLSDLNLRLGRVDEAVIASEQLLTSLRDRGSSLHLALALCNCCAAKVQADDNEGAMTAAVEALAYLREEGLAVWLFDHFALLLHRKGMHEKAARLVGFADAARASCGKARTPLESSVRSNVQKGAAAELGRSSWDRLCDEGAALDPGAAEALALQAAGSAC